jgi:hypothetical protein
VVAKAKDESLKARDLVGYDNVPIDNVELVVSPIEKMGMPEKHMQWSKEQVYLGHEKELLNGRHTCLPSGHELQSVCELLYYR